MLLDWATFGLIAQMLDHVTQLQHVTVLQIIVPTAGFALRLLEIIYLHNCAGRGTGR